MKMRDICLADFRETTADDDKLRPVLIVSLDKFNRGDDVVILPISHSADPNDPHVYYIDGQSPEFRLTGLSRDPSSVKWTKPFTISRHIIKRRLGHLAPKMFAVVIAHIHSVFMANTT